MVKCKLADFGELLPAEKTIIEGLSGRLVTVISANLPPIGGSDLTRVRASFINWCLSKKGMLKELNERGFRIVGAWIESDEALDPELKEASTRGVDLTNLRLDGDLSFVACRFQDKLILRGISVRKLNVSYSVVPGISAEYMSISDDVWLRELVSFGEVTIIGSQISGILALERCNLHNLDGDALSADRVIVNDAVFFNNAQFFGEVRLMAAKIGGDLCCHGASFRAEVGDAISAERSSIGGAWFWSDGASAEGIISFVDANIGRISDQESCWEGAQFDLNRCRYLSFTGGGALEERRVEWLSLHVNRSADGSFQPQPWEQCAKVLKDMGYQEAYLDILLDKERRASRERSSVARLWARVLDLTIHFGLRPRRAFYWLSGLWILAVVVFSFAWEYGAMKPNSVVVLRAPEWTGCSIDAPPYRYLRSRSHDNQLHCFLDQPQGKSFPAFNSFVYSADVLVPLVEIEQQASWTPNEDLVVGAIAKCFMYFGIVVGWMLSLLAVAGVTGLVKSD